MLGREIQRSLGCCDDPEEERKLVFEAFARKFPLHPLGPDGHPYDGPNELYFRGHHFERYSNRQFCNQCRWEWIRAKADELQALDEAGELWMSRIL